MDILSFTTALEKALDNKLIDLKAAQYLYFLFLQNNKMPLPEDLKPKKSNDEE